jgi:hypothetical protein
MRGAMNGAPSTLPWVATSRLHQALYEEERVKCLPYSYEQATPQPGFLFMRVNVFYRLRNLSRSTNCLY